LSPAPPSFRTAALLENTRFFKLFVNFKNNRSAICGNDENTAEKYGRTHRPQRILMIAKYKEVQNEEIIDSFVPFADFE
jgi:hypothetical protein